MSSRPVTAWLFGKMPTHGDFVSRGLTPERRDRLDAWLSDEMIQSRQHYGDGFEAAFDAAPPWRFTNEDEAAGWEGGALCASMDSAGRRFPLIVGRAASEGSEAARVADACETSIYHAFDNALSADDLWVSAREISLPDDSLLKSGWWTDGNDEFPARHLTRDAFPVGLISTMLDSRIDE
jgi:type VI secretion system protein ImpM